MKILVTGGAGFIGSHLVERLVADHHDVHVIDNLWRGRLENLRRNDEFLIDRRSNFLEADLTDANICRKAIRDFDLVYHIADIVAGVDFAFANEYYIFRQNTLINTNVLGACVDNGIRNYVYVGTACSYPKHQQMSYDISILTEDQTYPAEPESSYGWSKLMGEYEAELAMKEGKLNVGLLRLHNVYGERASYQPGRSQVIPSLIHKTLTAEGRLLEVWGSGRQYRDFIYVRDVVEALVLMAARGMNQGLIQVGSDQATTIRRLAELIVEISERDLEITFTSSKPEGDLGRIARSDRAREILHWSPKTDLKEGLQHTFNWIAEDLRSHARSD